MTSSQPNSTRSIWTCCSFNRSTRSLQKNVVQVNSPKHHLQRNMLRFSLSSHVQYKIISADYAKILEDKRFTREFLPYIQIIRKKHLISCVNSQLPLLLIEDFHAEFPPDQPMPREVVKHASLHRHSTLQQSPADTAQQFDSDKNTGQTVQSSDLPTLKNRYSSRIIQNKEWKHKMNKLQVNQQNASTQIE